MFTFGEGTYSNKQLHLPLSPGVEGVRSRAACGAHMLPQKLPTAAASAAAMNRKGIDAALASATLALKFAPTRKFHVCVARTEAPVILPSVQVRFKLLLLRISPRIVQTLTRFVSHTRALVAVAGFLRFFEVSAELCVGDCRLAGLALGGARGGGGPRGRFLAVGTRLCARCRPKS